MPRLKALNHYWADSPPLHKLVAAYMGVEPATPSAESIEQAAEFVPVETLSASEFDDLLKQHGLPIGK